MAAPCALARPSCRPCAHPLGRTSLGDHFVWDPEWRLLGGGSPRPGSSTGRCGTPTVPRLQPHPARAAQSPLARASDGWDGYGLQSEGQLQVFSPGPQLPLPQRVHRCALGAVEMHCPSRGSSASAWTRSGQQCENDLADAMPPSGTQVSETGAQAPLACSTKPAWQSHS
jgi:hypothetical protein